MLYKREIYDQVTIQYIILYTLAEANRIVTHNQLTSLVLDNCNIRFTEFRIALDNLETIGHIHTFSPDGKETYCELLPLGKEANGFFYHKIPKYIREPIKEYIAPFFREDAIKKSIKAELLPLSEKEFMADLGIFDGNTPIMKLGLYAGSRKSANILIKKFKKDPQKIYEEIINLFENISDEEPSHDDTIKE